MEPEPFTEPTKFESTKPKQCSVQELTKQEEDYVEIKRAELTSVMYGKYDLNEVVFTVVKELQNVSIVRFHNISTIVNVLKGAEKQFIFEHRLHKVPEFGALQEMQYDIIRTIVEWMIAEHFILKTKERYPRIHSTYEGLHYSEFITVHKLKKLKKYLEEEIILWEQ